MVISEVIWSVVIYLVCVYQRVRTFGGTHTHAPVSTCNREQLHGLNLRERKLHALSHQSSPSSSLLRRLTTIIISETEQGISFFVFPPPMVV